VASLDEICAAKGKAMCRCVPALPCCATEASQAPPRP